jgi:hypothetical protein
MNSQNKKILRIIIYLGLLVAALSMLATTSRASEFESNFDTIPAVQKSPPRVGFWLKPPQVVVCMDAPISQIQLNSALSLWTRLGYKFGQTHYKSTDVHTACTMDTPAGYIVINLVPRETSINPTSLAETRFFVNNNTNEIEWATINMRPDVRPMVLEHEIGHAMGFLHYDTASHLMHSKWALTGWGTEGLIETRR